MVLTVSMEGYLLYSGLFRDQQYNLLLQWKINIVLS